MGYRCGGVYQVSIGLVNFLRRKDVDEYPAQCVYQAVDCVTAQAVDLTGKGAIRIIGGQGDRQSSHPIARQPPSRTSSSTITMTSQSTFCCDQIRCLWQKRCYFSHATKLSLMIDHHDDGMLVSACR